MRAAAQEAIAHPHLLESGAPRPGSNTPWAPAVPMASVSGQCALTRAGLGETGAGTAFGQGRTGTWRADYLSRSLEVRPPCAGPPGLRTTDCLKLTSPRVSPHPGGSARPRAEASYPGKEGTVSSCCEAVSRPRPLHHAWRTWQGLGARPPLAEGPSKPQAHPGAWRRGSARTPTPGSSCLGPPCLHPQKCRKFLGAGVWGTSDLVIDGLCDPRVALNLLGLSSLLC